MRVRHANPDIRIVSGMGDRRFAEHLEEFLGVQTVLSSADLAAPVFAGAEMGVEITQKLEIKGEQYSTIHLPVEAGSFFVGRTVGDLQTDHDLDIVLVERSGEVSVQPERDITLQAGDGGGFPEHGGDHKVSVLSPCGIPGVSAFMVAGTA
jgi:Trk K+ transport system NAD-binding subunit